MDAHDPLLSFRGVPWEHPAPGLRQKQVRRGGRRLRLAEFAPGFQEPGWCRKGHWGYVLEGRLTVAFRGRTLALRAGDGLHIPHGRSHRAQVTGKTPALLLLFEAV